MVPIEAEDFNIPSRQRQDVLSDLSQKFLDGQVSRAFWAFCHVANLECLRYLATLQQSTLELIELECDTKIRYCWS